MSFEKHTLMPQNGDWTLQSEEDPIIKQNICRHNESLNVAVAPL